MLTGYRFYCIYSAIKLHFTSPTYNAIKYNNTSKAFSKDNFNNRNDRSKFDYWAQKIQSDKKALDFCIFNFVHSDRNWLYEDFDKANEIYNVCTGFFQSITHNIKKEHSILVDILKREDKKLSDLIKETKSGNKPPLLQMLLQGKLSKEFVCLLNKEYKFADIWKNMYVNDPLISDELLILTKYEPFVTLLMKRNKVGQEIPS